MNQVNSPFFQFADMQIHFPFATERNKTEYEEINGGISNPPRIRCVCARIKAVSIYSFRPANTLWAVTAFIQSYFHHENCDFRSLQRQASSFNLGSILESNRICNTLPCLFNREEKYCIKSKSKWIFAENSRGDFQDEIAIDDIFNFHSRNWMNFWSKHFNLLNLGQRNVVAHNGIQYQTGFRHSVGNIVHWFFCWCNTLCVARQ